jgi:hypothetical protein
LGEPGAHGLGQAFGLNAKARFDETFGKRQCVVKFSFAGKIAHTKIVEPIKGTWPALLAYKHIDAEFPGEHEASIARGRTAMALCSKFLAAAESAN